MAPKIIRKGLFQTVSGMVLLLLLSQQGFALPSSKRLFQSKYGFKVSCALCHTDGGGSRRNEYGKSFFKAGFSVPAFQAIESTDSDGDGTPNLQEIQAKSNPGDAKSTPKAPGDWLQKVDEVSVPREQLLKIFPKAQQFAAVEGEVKPEQVTAAEKTLGRKLSPEEKVPTYYFSIQDKKRVGAAQFFDVRHGEAQAVMGFGVDTDGKLLHAVVLHEHHAKSLKKFLNQLVNQTVTTLKTVDAPDPLNQQVVQAVQGALVVMNQVFSSAPSKESQ